MHNTFKRIVRSIRFGDIRLPNLRHTFATLSLQSGDSIETVSENLGHKTFVFALDVYGHVSEQMKKNGAARMEAYIKAVKWRLKNCKG